MKTNKLLPILGLCKKAGRLKYGFDSVKETLRKKEANLLVFASDTSEKTKGRIERLAAEQNIRTICAPFSMSELAHALGLGKNTAIAAICDKGLAELFLRRIEES